MKNPESFEADTAAYARETGGNATRFLDLVCALNERCLEIVSQPDPPDTPRDCCSPARVVQPMAWRRLGAPGRRRLAQLPFLIVDIHFMDPAWWRGATAPVASEPQTPAPFHADRDASLVALTHETMMLAWHAVQLDRVAATWKIGMSREVACVIWQLSTQDVLRIAAHCPHEAQPRWGTCVDFWHRLVAAAEDGDRDAFQDARIGAMLRLSGELTMADRIPSDAVDHGRQQ